MDARDRIVQVDNYTFVLVNKIEILPDSIIMYGHLVDEMTKEVSPIDRSYRLGSSHDKFRESMAWVRSKRDGNELEVIELPPPQQGQNIPPHVDPWDVDMIQFPRLLTEIKVAGRGDEILRLLKKSTSLSADQICELLDRAEKEFARITKQMSQPMP